MLLLCWVWTFEIKTYLAVSRSDCVKYENEKTIFAALNLGMTVKISEKNS